METRTKLYAAGLIVLREQKLLLAYSRNKKAWYLPGGKIHAGETAIEALQREIAEELNVQLRLAALKYYCHITAPAFGENAGVIMEQECFIYRLTEQIEPGNEIADIRYFDLEDYLMQPVHVPGVLMVFDKLSKDQLIQY